jgi:predicted amidohydrolase
MKIGIAQISPRLGDVKKNMETHLAYIEKARAKKIDLLIFPELSLTGYTLKDLVEEVALDPTKDPLFKKMVRESRGLSLVAGFAEERGEERGLFYNSAAFISNGKILHTHRKVFLPTTGMFEEGKFFAAGRDFRTFQTPFGRVGLLVCLDFLHYGASYVLYAGGADMLIAISAAPGRGVTGGHAFETSRMWELMGEAISYFSTAFVVYGNRVGFEDGVSFAGGSFLYAPGGKLLARAAYLDPEFLIQSIDFRSVREARKKWLYKRDEKPEIILRSLERQVRAPED